MKISQNFVAFSEYMNFNSDNKRDFLNINLKAIILDGSKLDIFREALRGYTLLHNWFSVALIMQIRYRELNYLPYVL